MSTYTYKQILSKATSIKNNVAKNYKLGEGAGWSYYIAKAILTPKKAITRRAKIGSAPKPFGTKFEAKIPKNDYLQLCKNLIAFVDKYDRLPNRLTWGDKNIRVRQYVWLFSKILVYYNEKAKLPTYVQADTSVFTKPKTYKKYGHATNSGCDNRGQNNGYYCGCHSLQEVFRNLTGIVVSQSTIASVCGTTTDGTDHDGLNTCVAWFNRKYDKNLSVKWYNFSDLGWNGIRKIINSNNQDCIVHNLYRNQWGHYEVINKIYDDYCDVQNSLGDYCDYGCYCGYVEERYLSTFRSYISGISQKSIMVITNE